MRSKDNLFHLIKAMSKSEKRYFVLDAKKSGREASRYLSLFDTMNDMEELDDEALKLKFPKTVSADKAYLYEAILRSMRDYRSPASKAAQVKERLMDARFLYERGLYDQSTQRIMEAKAMARELEDQFTLLEINKEEQVSLFDRKVKVELEHVEKLNEGQEEILNSINEELKYLDLHYRLGLEVVREFNLKDEGSIEELERRLPVALLEDKNKPKSPQAIHRFFLCNAVYYNLRGELEKVYDYFLKAVEWWEEHPRLKEEEYHRYIIHVFNLVNTAYKIEKYADSTQIWLDKLEKEKESQGYHNQKLIFLYISMSSLLHLLNHGDFEKAHKLLPEIVVGQNKFGLKKSTVLTGNIVTVYFLVKDYANSIKYADHIIKTTKSNSREDIQRIVRVYKIISLFEQDKLEQADAEIRSTNRFFKLLGLSKDTFEEVVLNVYLKRIFTVSISEIKPVVADFRKYLEGLKNDPRTENLLGVDELLIWAKGKRY